eukprot:2210036-Pleurochrysis_carterae.AAC.4
MRELKDQPVLDRALRGDGRSHGLQLVDEENTRRGPLASIKLPVQGTLCASDMHSRKAVVKPSAW